MIRVEGVVKSFGSQCVLDGLTFELPAGAVAALMGPSGTGKSVLLMLLAGLMRPDKGLVVVDGVSVSKLHERELLAFRRRIGFLFQDGALYDFMTILENVAFPLREQLRLSAREAGKKAEEFLLLVGLKGSGNKYPAELSGGMRKRAALARAMVAGPKVLLCDEPTSGLDPVRCRDISALIRDLSARAGCTTLFTTHDAQSAFRTGERVIMLNAGRIAADGTESMLRQSPDPFVRDFLN